MAFVAEDGSGKSDANAYVAVAFADTYHLDRGNAGWTGADAVKETALIRATDYIDKRFGNLFRGYRRAKDQALEWPRLDAYDNDGFAFDGVDIIPRKLQQACAEYALRALANGPLAPDPAIGFATKDNTVTGGTTTAATGGELIKQKSKVGPVEEELGFSPVSQSLNTPGNFTSKGNSQVPGLYIVAYPAADMLIEELIESTISRDLGRG